MLMLSKCLVGPASAVPLCPLSLSLCRTGFYPLSVRQGFTLSLSLFRGFRVLRMGGWGLRATYWALLPATHMHACRCWPPLICIHAGAGRHSYRCWPPLLCMHAGTGRHSYACMQVLAATHMHPCRCWPPLICLHAGAGRHSYACMQVLAATLMHACRCWLPLICCMQVLAATHLHACRCWPALMCMHAGAGRHRAHTLLPGRGVHQPHPYLVHL